MSRTSLTLLKWVSGPWESVREYLRQDLDAIQLAVNTRQDNGGITQLIDDVSAGPGDGVQSATVEGAPLTDVVPATGTVIIDFRNKRFGRFTFTQTGNVTLGFANQIKGGCYVFWIKGGAGFTLTWDSRVVWVDGDTPPDVAAGKLMLFTFGYDTEYNVFIGSWNGPYTLP